jgi:polar amino acid transport system substrate-binding protein
MRKIAVLAALLFTLLSQTAWAKTIVFACNPTWPPMEFIGPDKQIIGFDVDFMTAAGKEAGFTVEFKNTAWDGIFAGLAVGRYDAICSSVSITEERKKTMDFSVPYYKVRQALVVPVDSAAKSLEDMKGKQVGAQISTTGHFAVKSAEGVKDKYYDEVGLAFEDLFNGRIVGVVCDDPVAAQYVLQTEKYKGKFKIGGIIETKEAEFYGVPVKKGDAETLALINKGIEAVKAKGIDKELIKKWIGQ